MGTYRGIARVFAYSAWSIVWLVAPTAIDKLKRLNPRIREMSFCAFHTHERFRSHLFSKRK
jgi:type IV secretory pathway TrbD component